MKFLLSVFCIAIILTSCKDPKKEKVTYLPSSTGQVNTLSVVADIATWEGNVGETIRGIFAAPLVGLPQEEPLFAMKQIPEQAFEKATTFHRIILKVNKTDVSNFEIKKDLYSKPQTVIEVSATSDEDLANLLKDNAEKMIDAFNKQEVREKQRQIRKSLLTTEAMENQLGFTINIPSIYRIPNNRDDKDFFWIRRSLQGYKTMDLMFYEVPLEAIKEGDSAVSDIVEIRNKMIASKDLGEDGMTMKVEESFTPAIFNTIIDNKKAYETRGLWIIKDEGSFMSGPFINYAIEDKINKRYLIAEGYVYAPSLDKRSLVFELEAILKSIKIK